jgi:pyruvate kinase
MTDEKFSKRTKIIATLGPASFDAKVIREMIQNGVDMFRLNASHNAEPESINKLVKTVRKEAKKCERYIGIFMDLQGPKIRLGKIKDGKATLKVGASFSLTSEEIEGTDKKAYVSYEKFVEDIVIGDPIFIDDGKVRLIAKKKVKNEVVCEVVRGGVISNHKGVNLPDTKMSVSPFTKKDQVDAVTAINAKVDYIALSFVSEEEDVQNFKAFLEKHNATEIKVISKIERQRAVDNLVPLIEASDAVMVARGDLGVEIGVEKVPKVQKRMIRECNRRIKPVIVATQMLESMINSEVATRAEVSDIANAIYDHCDAVMLSGETAVGINPVNVIKTMADICVATDKHMIAIRKEDDNPNRFRFANRTIATSCCKAADQVAEENNAAAIIAFTSSGNTPLIASKLNSIFPIIAPTDEAHLCQRMSLYRGVVPMMMPKKFKDIIRWTNMINMAGKEAVKLGFLQKNDTVVVTAGIPIGQSNGINSIRILTV